MSVTLTQNIDTPQRILKQLAQELSIKESQTLATIELLDDGATVPFIARYRKEVTGGLDDTILRNFEVRLSYLRELEERRASILSSIESQGKLSDPLRAEITSAQTKQRLEDLYLPYKPKRRTRAQIAKEAGLEPLAELLLNHPELIPEQEAQAYINSEHNITDTKQALDGARDILTEQFSENADLLTHLRDYLWEQGYLYAKVVEGKEQEGNNFQDWFDFNEPIRLIPSHRALALFRGRQQGILNLQLGLQADDEALVPHPCIIRIADFLKLNVHIPNASVGQKWLADVCRWAWRVKLLPGFESELMTRLRDDAETEAIRVFAMNLKDLLLAAPAGPKAVLGLDPGIRTGVKVAAIDKTGKLLSTTTVFPHEPRKDWDGSIHTLAKLCQAAHIELIAIGNGTASRETEKLVTDLMKHYPELGLKKIVVSEAGASVYSASELAALEFPDLDVSLRGAVSIARRLQDPLAELVKIDPKSIGVGQYQHDVNQRELMKMLDGVVEDCVNAVGVDVNTASAPLLTRVSGLNLTLAKNIVQWRDNNGAFNNRKALMKVPRFGEKAFEQAAGFLRIANGDTPLDRSAVHPEAYPVVEQILTKIQSTIQEVMGNKSLLTGVSPKEFVSEQFGLPTVQDILNELEKPGRDPRPEFKTATFMEGVETIKDLKLGMILEGVITNVANFGAFVDIGVHQDGLVHISALSTQFVKDPREFVKVGQTVSVKVIEVDIMRKRIALSMRLDDEIGNATQTRSNTSKPARRQPESQPIQNMSSMAQAFAKLKQK